MNRNKWFMIRKIVIFLLLTVPGIDVLASEHEDLAREFVALVDSVLLTGSRSDIEDVYNEFCELDNETN